MITRLALTDFRSYATATFDPGPGFVVLVGDNGAGKTNILEAISLLGPGRGLRGAMLADLARKNGSGGFGVAADVSGVRLGTGVDLSAASRRVARINGVTTTMAALADWISLIWLTPAQDRLFLESAGDRRRFLDRLIFALEPGHARHVTRYDAAMRQRNRLLSERRREPEWLAALESAMDEHGSAIFETRQRFVSELTQRLDQKQDDAFPAATLQLSNGMDGLKARLAADRDRDAAAGRTRYGPHSQDLLVTYRAKNQPASQCSTGEQKALLIGIVLAHAALIAEARGAPPVLLLDEVAAHLDPARREGLFVRLAAMQCQAWLTGTEPEPFASLRATRYLVLNNGFIETL